MAYYVDYSTAASVEEKRNLAIQGIQDFWNNDAVFCAVCEEVLNIPEAERTATVARSIAFSLSFGGVEGYPVVAFIAQAWKISDEEVQDMLR